MAATTFCTSTRHESAITLRCMCHRHASLITSREQAMCPQRMRIGGVTSAVLLMPLRQRERRVEHPASLGCLPEFSPGSINKHGCTSKKSNTNKDVQLSSSQHRATATLPRTAMLISRVGYQHKGGLGGQDFNMIHLAMKLQFGGGPFRPGAAGAHLAFRPVQPTGTTWRAPSPTERQSAPDARCSRLASPFPFPVPAPAGSFGASFSRYLLTLLD